MGLVTVNTPAPTKKIDLAQLDELTLGAFTAPTAGERAARIRDWLATNPANDALSQVFKELSVKDKGAAKLVRERLDEGRRMRDQEALVAQWAEKAQSLLALAKLNIADALAWQRDAAKAGAPLSREPLAGLKQALAERVRGIEDLQHRTQVQREAAVLLAQRIEVLSTKPWQDAQAAREVLQADVQHWQNQALALAQDAAWISVEPRFTGYLDSAKTQLLAVWEAFGAALDQAIAASEDVCAPLPPVPVWADALRAARPQEPGNSVPTAPKAVVDPAAVAAANEAVEKAVLALEQELSQGHGKASAGAALALRASLKEHSRGLDSRLDARAHAALGAAGELEGWQRWRSDQLREELVRQAEALLQRPAGQALGGRKMQESLRFLREQWKQTDQGGAPNHGLWRRFDAACNEAYKTVESWLEKAKAESAEHKKQRQGLIAELQAWTVAQGEKSDAVDWKAQSRELHQFGDRWREAGHVGDKLFTELQGQWKAAMAAASQGLEAAQAQSLARRNALIEEAQKLGQEPNVRIDAIKALQQRWQVEAQGVPMDRRQEQKLWDAFRKPLDEVFERKTAQRQRVQAELSGRDRAVVDAARALEEASKQGDAAAIRAAMQALDAAGHDTAAPTPEPEKAPVAQSASAEGAAVGAAKSAKPVVAVRGDDRPGMRREAAAAQDVRTPSTRGAPGGPRGGAGRVERRERPVLAPRLGDQAFRAQRDAMDRAQAALRQLAAQAHGEAVTQLLRAWQERSGADVPSAQALGSSVPAAVRSSWVRAVEAAPLGVADGAATSLLRLEMASEVPTPAAHLAQRRAYQLQLLTQRNAPSPAQTWGADVAAVLASAFEDETARRLQATLKALVRR